MNHSVNKIYLHLSKSVTKRAFPDKNQHSANGMSKRAEGEEKFGCRSEAEFKERCLDIDSLCDSIQEHGHLRGDEQAELDDDPMDETTKENYLSSDIDEIKVDIARDGELLHADGSHRLAITKALELEKFQTLCFVATKNGIKVEQNPHLNEINKHYAT